MESSQEVVNGVEVVYGHLAGELCSNVYLLESDEGTLMIDSGNGVLELERPELVILTHGHYDHTGGVKAGWKAYLHEKDFVSQMPFKVPREAKPLPMKSMRWGEFELEFIHTPGHTPGSICMLEKRNGILFSGDTLFSHGNYGRTDLHCGNEEQMRESLERLGKLEYG
ncbi:hypothetical protein DRN67_04245, partial [Candidatus Micrarchaeota archaeon]